MLHNSSQMPKTRPFSLKFHLIAYSGILAISVVLFRATNLDFLISDLFYFRQDNWTSVDHPFWGIIYKAFTVPNILLLNIGLVMFFFHWLISKNRAFRLKALCIVAAIILGPGVLINATLKPMMGRPRPYDMERYGGSDRYVELLQPSNKGKSFPSGHAAAGFALTILFYIFYRTRRRLAWFFWFGGMGFGIMLSIGRIAQGGHFTSDCIWALGLTQIVNALVYFRLEPRIEKSRKLPAADHAVPALKEKTGFAVLTLFFSSILWLGFLINHHFTYFRVIHDKVPPKINRIVVEAPMEAEKVKLYSNSNRNIGIDHLVLGNGFPWSDVTTTTSSRVIDRTMYYRIDVDRAGFFREYNGRVKLFIPENIEADLSSIKGEIVEDNRK